MSKLRKGLLVVVDWLDSYTPDPGWERAASVRPAKCRSVGYIVGLTKEAITLAADGAASGKVTADYVNRPITIPRGMVTRIRKVSISQCEVLR